MSRSSSQNWWDTLLEARYLWGRPSQSRRISARFTDGGSPPAGFGTVSHIDSAQRLFFPRADVTREERGSFWLSARRPARHGQRSAGVNAYTHAVLTA